MRRISRSRSRCGQGGGGQRMENDLRAARS
jgi:hypothetical protein